MSETNDLFYSPKYSVRRAKKHADELKRQLAVFVETKPYLRIVEHDPDTNQDLHKIKLVQPLPDDLPGLVFDAANHLRSALDQTIFAIAGKGNFFPFGTDDAGLENVIKGNCKGVPPTILALIRAFQPYATGNYLLWAINYLANTNKHAIILNVATATAGNFTLHGVTELPTQLSIPQWDSTKNEMIYGRTSVGDEYQSNLSFSLCISIQEPEFLSFQPVDAVVDEFIRMVEGVVETLETESRRIGLS